MGRYADFRHSARPTPLAWRHCRCREQGLQRQWQLGHHSVYPLDDTARDARVNRRSARRALPVATSIRILEIRVPAYLGGTDIASAQV